MLFLLLNQFYPPDMAPTGRYLHDLARVLVQRGHQVKVLCSRRSYDGAKRYPRHEIMDGVEVARLPATGFGRRGFIGKIADYASFYASLLTVLMVERSRPDLILSLTTPPYIGLLAKLAAKRHGSRHAHWIMDLYPDVMFAHGMARNDGLLFCSLQKLTQFQFKGASQVLALGPTMAESVAKYNGGHKTTRQQDDMTTRPQDNGTADNRPQDRAISSRVVSSSRSPVVSSPPPQVSGPVVSSSRSPLVWFPLWSDPDLAPWPDSEPNPVRIERGWSDSSSPSPPRGDGGGPVVSSPVVSQSRGPVVRSPSVRGPVVSQSRSPVVRSPVVSSSRGPLSASPSPLRGEGRGEVSPASSLGPVVSSPVVGSPVVSSVVFLYSGNMGLGHRFGEFLEAARRLGASGPRWVFAGGGKRRAEIEAAAKSIPGDRIEFLDYVPHDKLRAHLCAADVHLASLDSAWQGFMVPSKLQGSFAVGRPVIYVGGRKCETAVWILESGGGWVVDENDIEGLLKAIQQALDPVERRTRGQAALEFAHSHFQMSATCTRIAQLLENGVRGDHGTADHETTRPLTTDYETTESKAEMLKL